MIREQEHPTFAVGDRFRLMQIISVLDQQADGMSYETYPAGLKGAVIDTDLWEEEGWDDRLNGPVVFASHPYLILRFDTFPDRKIKHFHLEEVATKAVNLE